MDVMPSITTSDTTEAFHGGLSGYPDIQGVFLSSPRHGYLTRPWLTAMLAALVIGSMRSIWARIVDSADYFFSYAYIESIHEKGDDSYDCLVSYWSEHLSFARSRKVFLQTNPGVYNSPSKIMWMKKTKRSRADQASSKDADEDISPMYRPTNKSAFWFVESGTLLCISQSKEADS